MLQNVFTRSLAERSRSSLAFALGAAALIAMYVSVFPSMQDQMVGYAEALPEAMASFMGSDFADPAGYLHSTVFTILGPLLMVAAAATWGAAAIAGDEEAHTLALLLSAPLSRARVAAEKAGAVVVALTAVAAVAFGVLVAMVATTGMGVAVGNLLAAVVHLHALALFAAAVAFGLGAATGRRSLALGAATGIVVVGFVLNGVSGFVEGLDFLRWISVFYWYGGTEPVLTGAHFGHLALLWVLAAVIAAAGVRRFTRRDLN